MVDVKNGEVGALKAPFKWLMKQKHLITALLSQRPPSPATATASKDEYSGSYIRFTYSEKAVSQQMTVLCTERQHPWVLSLWLAR